MRSSRSMIRTLTVAAISFGSLCARPAHADDAPGSATESSATQPGTNLLRIVITAIQGGVDVKENDKAPFRLFSVGEVFTEGCEFRTGPKGTVQFMVGTDQVFRIDRLTDIQIYRANLKDGKITTTAEMTYGRVSKDVDAPIFPHDDSIQSPSTTLAVRGTRVSLYDQPPFEPEAVSLTGAATLSNLRGQLVHFGSKGQGPAKIAGDAPSAAQYQYQSTQLDALGAFSARSDSEEAQLNYLSGLGGVFQVLEVVREGLLPPKGLSVIGSTPPGETVLFPLAWVDGPSFTVVDYTVTGPHGGKVSVTNPNTASGGYYNTNSGQSQTANASGIGQQEIDWSGNSPNTSFPPGKYTLTETLLGTQTQSLSQDPSLSVKAIQAATIDEANGGQLFARAAKSILDQSTPTAIYELTVPFTNGATFNRILGTPAAEKPSLPASRQH